MAMNKTPPDRILNAMRLPARLSAEEAAVLLGYEPHDIPTLVARGLLKPLGSPTRNSTKRFAASEIAAKHNDVKWLSRAEVVVSEKWKAKNAQRFQTRKNPEVQP